MSLGRVLIQACMNEMAEIVQRAWTLLFLDRLWGLEKSLSARKSGIRDP